MSELKTILKELAEGHLEMYMRNVPKSEVNKALDLWYHHYGIGFSMIEKVLD